jgi:hypothetical protein
VKSVLDSVPLGRPSVEVEVVVLVEAFWVMDGAVAVPNNPVSVMFAAPSARPEMLMGGIVDVASSAPDVSKLSVPVLTVVSVPVPPVISAEGTVTAYVQVFAAVFV